MHDGKAFAAFLFDMDGTILTSIAVAERIWSDWATQHGIDPVAFLPTIHGVRGVETIARLNLPGIDPMIEAERITAAEMVDLSGIEPIPGAAAFLQALPPERWAVVTSAPRALALRRIKAVGLPVPAVLVAAEDVARGKPAPDCYARAAGLLGVAAADCLVFEDAAAGIAAAEAAGAAVLVITGAGSAPQLPAHPAVADYRGLKVVVEAAARAPLRLRSSG